MTSTLFTTIQEKFPNFDLIDPQFTQFYPTDSIFKQFTLNITHIYPTLIKFFQILPNKQSIYKNQTKFRKNIKNGTFLHTLLFKHSLPSLLAEQIKW